LIGCGFTDTWLDRNLDEILGQTGEVADVRHVAFVGIAEEDEKHMARYRNLMQNMYRIEVLFYRIKKTISGDGSQRSDHSDLLSALNEIIVELNPEKELKEMPVERVAALSPNINDILSSFSYFNRNL
jgi:hypothetical protein